MLNKNDMANKPILQTNMNSGKITKTLSPN